MTYNVEFSEAYLVDHRGIGGEGELPIVGDFNDDGLDDLGVYIPKSMPNGTTNAHWAFEMNRGNGVFPGGPDVRHTGIGGVGETPVVGDFNGDGLDDIGVYVPNGTVNALWAFSMNRGNGVFPGTFDVKHTGIGGAGETPVAGEYMLRAVGTGDGPFTIRALLYNADGGTATLFERSGVITAGQSLNFDFTIPVPEPGSLFSLLFCLPLACCRRRR